MKTHFSSLSIDYCLPGLPYLPGTDSSNWSDQGVTNFCRFHLPVLNSFHTKILIGKPILKQLHPNTCKLFLPKHIFSSKYVTYMLKLRLLLKLNLKLCNKRTMNHIESIINELTLFVMLCFILVTPTLQANLISVYWLNMSTFQTPKFHTMYLEMEVHSTVFSDPLLSGTFCAYWDNFDF